ncbi:hypothetical protein [Cerasicoccus fimbriatus]|uniref:hypothetical protein n=1 Tax=Cerasicoccus fimbriatus TaxID=3014554 RepID=UPI0022B2F270|nr:hypothetical protein [Cerasicoccus sp. TK19100]
MSHQPFPYPDGYHWRDIQLEMSLKPFVDNSTETREGVIREIFIQWAALTRHAESISIMLWIAEGSEILEYSGKLEDEFEWAKYHGAPNRHRGFEMVEADNAKKDPDHAGIGGNVFAGDPDRIGIHARSYLYREDPATFTFEWLRGLVADLKRIGREMTGKPIYVGETFDIGPEFAKSRFKFEWHREILGDGPVFKDEFISCEAVLDADDRAYAAFPKGIPQGTRIGTFLGKQANQFFEDMGFDFLWFSNGFGFSLEPWALVGEVFDGAEYHADRHDGIQQRVLQFWKDLREVFPKKYHIRTRGTNLATGIDLGSDASPLKHIFEGDFGLDAPVNSPWAALDGDFGLELSGWMSHVARHPGDTFRFRFYIHDPWWLNSPWLDRYSRQPHDIFLPVSVSRLTADGKVEIPRDLALLTIDDSHGHMPLSVPNEVTAFILKAREKAPDAPAPFLWVYPFDDFHEIAKTRPDITLHADAYIGVAINEGLPLNTVVDAKELTAALTASGQQDAILVTPVPQPGSKLEDDLIKLLSDGIDMQLYGPVLPGSAFLELLDLELSEPLEGDFVLQSSPMEPAEGGNIIRHTTFLSGGPWTETLRGKADVDAAEATQGKASRAAMVIAETDGGVIAWTRASLSTGEYNPDKPRPIKGPILKPMDRAMFYPTGRLLRNCLGAFGWLIDSDETLNETRPPYLTVHRWKNAFILSGHSRDENAMLSVRHPLGAPLRMNQTTVIAEGLAEITGEIAWTSEVRVFADVEFGVIKCLEVPQLMHGVHRRMVISGCEEATLSFLVEPGHTDKIRILLDPVFPYFVGEFIEPEIVSTPYGDAITVSGVSGSILFEW